MDEENGKDKPPVITEPAPASQSVASSQSLATPLSANAHQEDKNITPQPSQGTSEWLRDPDWQFVGVAIAIILFCISLLWSEFRSHEETRGKLARAEKAETDALAERDETRKERDQLRKELAALQKENAAILKQHSILQFYGPPARYIASYDLPKEVGSKFAIGHCPNEPCLEITLREITTGKDGLPRARLRVGGFLPGLASPGLSLSFQMKTQQGCKAFFEGGPYRVIAAIEEERFQVLRVGVGVSVIDRPRSNFFFDKVECLSDNLP